nr:LuxR C-terminal-related transcriptional regulator [Auraticoccus cholistanensis]
MVSLGQLPEVRERLTAWGGDRVHLAASTHLLLACGRADEAAALSDPLRWPPRTTRREQILLLLAQCGARHHLGQVGAAAAALRRAVNLTGHRGLAWLYAFACVDRPILTDLVRKVPEAAPIVVRLEELAPTDPTSQPAELQLTPREMLVLQQLARGLNIQQISEQLYVSPSTVKNQRKSIYRKLGASSRDEALAAAARRGLLVQTV